jgi:hypothetical protein
MIESKEPHEGKEATTIYKILLPMKRSPGMTADEFRECYEMRSSTAPRVCILTTVERETDLDPVREAVKS